MKHYGPDFEGDGTLAATGRLTIGASNITGAGSTVGLVITSAGANSFLNHQGREVPFDAAIADGGITTFSTAGATSLGTVGGTDSVQIHGNLSSVNGTVMLGNPSSLTTIGGPLTATTGNVAIGDGTAGSTTMINGETITVSGTTTFTNEIAAPGGITVGEVGTPQNLVVTGNLSVSGDSTLGDGGADIINLNSSDINLIDHANIPTSTAGTLLGFDNNGNVVRLSPESFNAISKTSTSTTEALAVADFVNAFNSAGTTFNGISFTAGDAINTGSLVLITNMGVTRTVTTDVNESFAGQANVSIGSENATNDYIGATFTNNGTLYTVVAVDAESGTWTVDQNLTATISAATDLTVTLPSEVEQYLFTGASTTATADGTNDITASELIDVSHGGDVVESLTALGGINLTGGPVGNIFIAVQSAPANTSAGDTLPTIQTDSNGITIVGSSIRTRHIEDAAITNVKLAADAVTTDKILDATITGGDIASATVATGNIALRAVNATLIDAATQANDMVLFLRQTTVGAVSTLEWASSGDGTVGKYSQVHTISAGNNSVTIAAATHGRGTNSEYIIQVQEAGSPSEVVIPDTISIASTGDVTITFGTNFAADTDFRITILG